MSARAGTAAAWRLHRKNKGTTPLGDAFVKFLSQCSFKTNIIRLKELVKIIFGKQTK
jgi:hypothetical protein